MIVIRVVFLLFVALLVGFLGAYTARQSDHPLAAYLDNVGTAVAGKWSLANKAPDSRQSGSADDNLTIYSTFVPLNKTVVPVPVFDRRAAGGALASWNDTLLVLDHSGSIFLMSPENDVTSSNIETPDNGLADYKDAATEEPFDVVEHQFGYFRYNDLEIVDQGDQRSLIISYTRYHKDRKCYTNTVSRLAVTVPDAVALNARSDDWETLFESEPCLPLKTESRAIEGHMAGGRIAFDGRRTLYLTSGEYAWDGVYGPRTLPGVDPQSGPAVAQDPDGDYGKVIAIDLVSGQARHVSRGHRNAQGITVDADGRVWVVEHGMRGGDELNAVIEGGNYGWPEVSYGTLYSGLPIPNDDPWGRHDRFDRPATAWLPSIAASALITVAGFHEAWNGDLLAGSLAGQKLVRIRVEDGRVVYKENIVIGERIRHLHQHTDGRIALWTDRHEVIFLSPSHGGMGQNYVNYRLDTLTVNPDLKTRVQRAVTGCAECHSFNRGEHRNAPSLATVFGSRIGSTEFKRYSTALSDEKRIWDRELMTAYLGNPQATLPGTQMTAPGLDDPSTTDALINILEGLATDAQIPAKYLN